MVIKMTFKEYVQKDKKDIHNMHKEQVFKSEEGLKLIDNWVNKWAYIFRSLKKKTNNRMQRNCIE